MIKNLIYIAENDLFNLIFYMSYKKLGVSLIKDFYEIKNIYERFPSFLSLISKILIESVDYYQKPKSEIEIEIFKRKEREKYKNILVQYADFAESFVIMDLLLERKILKLLYPKKYHPNPLILIYVLKKYSDFFLKYWNKKARREAYPGDKCENDLIYDLGEKILKDTIKIITIIKSKSLITRVFEQVIKYRKLKWKNKDEYFLTPEHLAFHSFCSIIRYSKSRDILKKILKKIEKANLKHSLLYICFLRCLFKKIIINSSGLRNFTFPTTYYFVEKYLDIKEPKDEDIKGFHRLIKEKESLLYLKKVKNY